jgi:hypothetical protein
MTNAIRRMDTPVTMAGGSLAESRDVTSVPNKKEEVPTLSVSDQLTRPF